MEQTTDQDKRKDAYGLRQYYDGSANGPAPVDFVAVQGLNAHPSLTWTTKVSNNGKNRVASLRSLLKEDISNARILTFSYNSNYLRDSPITDLNTYAESLLEELKNLRGEKDKFRPIIFMGHSFGGIVIEQAILKAADPKQATYNDLYDATCGIIFLGTPFRGSKLADTGRLLATIGNYIGLGSEPNLLEGLRPDSKEYFDLSERFSTLIEDRKLFFFYETIKTPHLGVIVTKESACFDRLSEDTEKRVIPMYKDHSGMNKFGARSDSDYQALIGKIKELAAFAASWRLRGLEKFYRLEDHRIRWGVLEDAFPYKRANRLEPILDEHVIYKPNQVTPWNEGTCKWLLKSTLSVSADWMARDASAFLWVRGPAGCGKTILSSYLINELMTRHLTDVPVLYFFIKGTSKLKASNPNGILTSEPICRSVVVDEELDYDRL